MEATPTSINCDPSRYLGHVLVVEDDENLQCLIALGLTSGGYQVACAGNGEVGWQMLETGRFDLLITDNEMPKLSGRDLIKRVRMHFPDLPIIFISGETPRDTAALTASPLLLSILEKPFSQSRLIQCVKTLLSSKRTSSRQTE